MAMAKRGKKRPSMTELAYRSRMLDTQVLEARDRFLRSGSDKDYRALQRLSLKAVDARVLALP